MAIIFLDVVKIAKLASAFKVLMFIFNELTVIVLRETNAQWYKPTFKSPLYPWVQAFGIVSGIVLLAFLGIMPVVSVLGVVVLGFLIFLVYGSKSDRSGVATSYGIISSFFKGASKIRAGQVTINKGARVRSAPFGGYGSSGNGREHGTHGLEECLETKAVIGALVE